MRRKKGEERAVPEGADARITPVDIQQVEFRLAFRGYNERDVDAFLDRITEDIASYLEENGQLRGGMGPATVGRVSVGDGPAEAEAIVSRAREEAAAIVRRAEQDAAAIRGSTGARGDTRAAVAPFLNAEREFLQSLGSLVQTHAEEIKQMVLSLRAREESAAAAVDREPKPVPAVAGAASVAEIRERLGARDVDGPDTGQAGQIEGPPVLIESATEPAYSSEGAPANEGRERSLRELFWGGED
ncbi:MAG: DivIVA domain-containing protein [Actinomycetota bacterium]